MQPVQFKTEKLNQSWKNQTEPTVMKTERFFNLEQKISLKCF